MLIIDDFMANGFAVQGLVDIVNAAGAKLEGIGIAVEKGFQGGGDRFRASGIPYKALAVIEKADENGFHTCGLRSVNSNAHVVGIYDRN